MSPPAVEDDSPLPVIDPAVLPTAGEVAGSLPGAGATRARDAGFYADPERPRGASDATPLAPAGAVSTPHGSEPAALQPRLLASAHEGALCPPGSLTVRDARPGHPLTIELASDLHAQGRAVEERCRIELALALPQGLRIARARVQLFGHSWSNDGASDLQLRIGDANGSAQGDAAETFAGAHGPFALRAVMDSSASSCAGGDARAEVVLDLSAAARGTTHLQLANIQLGLSPADGALWQRCADGRPVSSPLGALGDRCAPGRQACAAGLTCDLVDAPQPDDALLTGTCVRPSERLAPQAKGGPCGGARAVACQSGLVCHYENAARAARELVGVCVDRAAEIGDVCGGSPAIACAAGTFCGARGRCRVGDGDRGSACELGLSTCDGDLICSAGACAPDGSTPAPPAAQPTPPASQPQPPTVQPQPPTVEPRPPTVEPQPPTSQPSPPDVTRPPVVIGSSPNVPLPPASCDGSRDVLCAPPGDGCDPEVAGCLTPAGAKPPGERCLDVSECAFGLRCQSHFCRGESDGFQWSSCEMDSQCRGYLKCDPERKLCLPYSDRTEGSTCGSDDGCNPELHCVDYVCVPIEA